MQASDAHVVAACTVAGSPRASIANARRAMCELAEPRQLAAALRPPALFCSVCGLRESFPGL